MYVYQVLGIRPRRGYMKAPNDKSPISFSSGVPRYVYIICAVIGAFVGFLIPDAKTHTPVHAGVLGAVLAFELNYPNLFATVGLVWLLYWLVKGSVHGRQAL